MLSLLTLAVVAGLVWTGFTAFQRTVLASRRPGLVLQGLPRSRVSRLQLLGAGTVAAASLIALLTAEPDVPVVPLWVLWLVFIVSVFETSGWATGLYHFAFHERGLWHGRSWRPYTEVRTFEVYGETLVLVLDRGRRLVLTVPGGLSPEVRVRLALEP